MDVERYHREVAEYGRSLSPPSIRRLQVYRGSEACERYCVAREAGAAVVFVGSKCRCGQHHKNELRDQAGNGEIYDGREEDQSGTDASELAVALDSTNETPTLLLPSFASELDAPTTASLAASNSNDVTAASTTAPSTETVYANAAAAESSATNAPIGDSNSSGLSNGGKIGLGVGLGLGIALLLAAIAFFCLFRRRKRRAMDMGAKYTPHAQSDLSMIEQSHRVQMKAEQAEGPQAAERQPLQGDFHEPLDTRHSQLYHEPPAVTVLQAPAEHAPVTPIEAEIRGNDHSRAPLALAMPGEGRRSGISRDQSPVRSHSPVSPVSPLSARSAASSSPPSPKAK